MLQSIQYLLLATSVLQASPLHLPLHVPQAEADPQNTSTNPPLPSLTSIIPILHPDSPQNHLTKRSARLLDHCPPSTYFLVSHCVHYTSPRAYSLSCRNHTSPWEEINLHGSCRDDEFCIDTAPPQNGYLPRAYCLGHDNYLRTARILAQATGESVAAIVVDFNMQRDRESGYGFAALVTSLDGRQILNTTSLSVQALGLDGMHRRPEAYRALNGGRKSCRDCAEVGMFPVPRGTRRVSVDAVLKGVGVGGLLVLTSLEL